MNIDLMILPVLSVAIAVLPLLWIYQEILASKYQNTSTFDLYCFGALLGLLGSIVSTFIITLVISKSILLPSDVGAAIGAAIGGGFSTIWFRALNKRKQLGSISAIIAATLGLVGCLILYFAWPERKPYA